MEIELLGSVALVQGEHRCAVASVRIRTLVALMALSPGSSRPFDLLVEQLWAGRPPGNARNALQANIVRLRKLFESLTGRRGDELLRTVSSGYLLDVPPDSVDAHRFLRLTDEGAAQVDRDPAAAVDLLERALHLWRGPALVDVPDQPGLREQSARLDERRLSAREDLIAAKLAIGEERGLVSELRQLAEAHPERERFSEQLMLALYRNGRQTEALDVFHRARRRLASELGLQPGRGMCRLYEAILVQDRVLG
ncbi:AfsR/SARP family transcriptional regulator [Kutzneria buriramensis]|uniref:DNA-binding SARP family transcriptional activator n=1 Tax=Kutzneria buriramensis TaxID=1045776 RepID=A0A3E0HPY3_9PSEU|nr:AfsR/SARP family transcriptional regulator [Kutzneria buriramensis]REH48478.1 DNA-binding SARP family transcriptional activator [Kutzneria buriramensis]